MVKQLQETITVCNDYFEIAHNTVCFHPPRRRNACYCFQMLREYESLLPSLCKICIGNSMICCDVWHKYHEWYFEIVIRNFETILKYHEWYLCQISLQIMLLFVYTTTRKRFVIFTCRYFKLSWNTTALSQSKCRNFSCSTIVGGKLIIFWSIKIYTIQTTSDWARDEIYKSLCTIPQKLMNMTKAAGGWESAGSN